MSIDSPLVGHQIRLLRYGLLVMVCPARSDGRISHASLVAASPLLCRFPDLWSVTALFQRPGFSGTHTLRRYMLNHSLPPSNAVGPCLELRLRT
jgi:hypothetical protein